MSSKTLRYTRNDFLNWSLAVCRDHPDLAEALMHMHDGLCHDDVVEIEFDSETPSFAVMTIVHGEEVE